RSQKVNNLDTGLQHFCGAFEVGKVWCWAVNRPAILNVQFGDVNVQGVTKGIEDVTFDDVAYRYGNCSTGVVNFLAAYQTVGGLHRDGANHVLTEVLSSFEGNGGFFAAEFYFYGQSIVDLRHCIGWEFSVDYRTGHAGNATHGAACGASSGFVKSGSHETHFYVDVEYWSVRLCCQPVDRLLRQCVRTGNKFGELLSNGSLTGVVHQQGVVTNEVIGVIACCAHSELAVGQCGGCCLQHGREDSRLNVFGKQRIQDIFWSWFVLVEREQFRFIGNFLLHNFQWKETNDRWLLDNHGFELGVDDMNFIYAAIFVIGQEGIDECFANLFCDFEYWTVG